MTKSKKHLYRAFELDLKPKRPLFMGAETPSGDADKGDAKANPEQKESKEAMPKRRDSIPVRKITEQPKDIIATLQSKDVVPAKMLRASSPYLKSPDEYPKGPNGEILDPLKLTPMSPERLKSAWEWYEKLPSTYKVRHEVPPEQMPDKLEIPKGKQLFFFGGENNGEGVYSLFAKKYPDVKMNFMKGATLQDMLAIAKEMGNKFSQDQLQGSTATVMVDPDIFFNKDSAETIVNTAKELAKTLKSLGLKVTMVAVPPIGDHNYERDYPKNSAEKWGDWRKNDVPREKRSQLNEAIFRMQLDGGIDKAVECSVPFSFFGDGTRLHPDYRYRKSYLSDDGLDYAARIISQDINIANGKPSTFAKANPDQNIATMGDGVPTPVLSKDYAPVLESAKANQDLGVSGKERLERLIVVVRDLSTGKFLSHDRDSILRTQTDIQWAKDMGIAPSDIEQLEKDFKRELPNLLFRIAEDRVKKIIESKSTPTEWEIHQAILAIEEAEKAGADTKKIAELKKSLNKKIKPEA